MLAQHSVPQPPAPGNPTEAHRCEHTRARYAMMEGRWVGLLQDRLEAQLGTVRRAAWGIPDVSSNPLRSVCTELACLYDAPPDVRHTQYMASPNIERMVGPNGELARAGLWPQMPRFQSLVIALREMWMRVDVVDGRLVFRPVPPHMTMADADPARPTVPTMLGELRLRRVEAELLWTWDVWDIRDPEAASFRVYEALDGWKFGRDLTSTLHGATYEGASYPAQWRRANGAPVIPAVLYHAAARGDQLFDPFNSIELFEGSLNLAVLYSYLNHAIRDASHPQRYAVGVRVSGMEATDLGTRASRAEVVTDPTTILMFDPVAETSQPMLGQYAAGADIEKLESVVAAQAHRLATDAGLAPSELQRTSGSARSGYAISLSQEGKRIAQRRYITQFQGSDEALVGLAAVMLNRWSEANAAPTNYPEGGWSVLYREVPLSPQELEARRTHVLQMMEAGLMSRVDALRYFGSLSEQDAVAQLAAIREWEASPEAAPTTPEKEQTGEAPPPGDVSRGEPVAVDEALDEVRASEEALGGLLEGQLTADQRDVVQAILESMREARGYLTGRPSEADVELEGEDAEES